MFAFTPACAALMYYCDNPPAPWVESFWYTRRKWSIAHVASVISRLPCARLFPSCLISPTLSQAAVSASISSPHTKIRRISVYTDNALHFMRPCASSLFCAARLKYLRRRVSHPNSSLMSFAPMITRIPVYCLFCAYNRFVRYSRHISLPMRICNRGRIYPLLSLSSKISTHLHHTCAASRLLSSSSFASRAFVTIFPLLKTLTSTAPCFALLPFF